MPLTALDAKAALISIDLQTSILGNADVKARRMVVENTSRLADAFHEKGLPVVWVRALGMPAGRKQAGPPAGEVGGDFAAPEEGLPIAEGDLEIFKLGLSAFMVPELHEELQKQGITQVVITGIATGIGVESTARSAFDLGYNVLIVDDAVVDPDAERHVGSLTRTMPGFAEVDSSAAVLAVLKN